MCPLPSLTQRYLTYYTPLIQEFVREVESLPHPDIAKMPEPFFPAFGKGYEQSDFRLVIIGQDTRGWGDLLDFLAREKATPGISLQNGLAEFQDVQDGKHSFTDWGHTRYHFWGFAMMLLAALHGQEQWGMMKQGAMNEVLDSFAWGNCNAVELYQSSPSRMRPPIPREYWDAVRKAGARFDRFKHIEETIEPHAAIVLWRGMHPESYFEGYDYKEISRQGRLIHYRLPEIGVDVFHAPHPRNMGYIEGADHFCAKLKEWVFKITPPFPKFLSGQAEAQEVLHYLRCHAPPPSPGFDKYAFVSWVAEELTNRGTFMAVPTLISLVNAKGYKTNYGTEYSGLRGSYRLVSGTYHRMEALGSPDGDTKAHNVAVAFRKPNFEYAYSTD